MAEPDYGYYFGDTERVDLASGEQHVEASLCTNDAGREAARYLYLVVEGRSVAMATRPGVVEVTSRLCEGDTGCAGDHLRQGFLLSDGPLVALRYTDADLTFGWVDGPFLWGGGGWMLTWELDLTVTEGKMDHAEWYPLVFHAEDFSYEEPQFKQGC